MFNQTYLNCSVITTIIVLTMGFHYVAAQEPNTRKPNFVVIFADDLGYGDLSCYGHPTLHTPNLDRMAAEGQKWTNFYAASSVCTPSRAGLLTGRLPVRSGMASNKQRVLYPDSKKGLPTTEITLAERLKNVGYSTACIGKWHLGHKQAYLPTKHGFDYYYGIPYSNDMDMKSDLPYWEYWQQEDEDIKTTDFHVPLLRNTEEIERPVNQHTLTKRYTEETIKFIQKHRGDPFFIYLAHNLPHVPLFVSEDFSGTSKRGLYGDVVAEIDHGVGQILETLKAEGLDQNTVVVFSSDNGPWVTFEKNGGSAGPLRAGKGTTWEGGMREPAIFWAPGKITPGLIQEIGSTMDLFATFSAMAGLSLPADREMDSKDLSEVLLKGRPGPRNSLLYYRGTELYAVRLGAYKAHFVTQGAYGQFGEREEHDPPLLFNLDLDPGEQYDLASENAVIIQQINAVVAEHESRLVRGPDQLAERE